MTMRKMREIFVKRVYNIALLCVAMLCMSSCASIFCGSKAKVTFDSVEPIDDEVTLVVEGRKYRNVTFPYTLKVPRGFDETVVKAIREGYKPSLVYVDKVFNPVAVINLADILAWGIDIITGAMMKPEFKFYEFEFEPLEKEQPVKDE